MSAVPNATDVLIEGIVEAVRDTMWFARGENSLQLTTTPISVIELADGSGRHAVIGTFVLGDGNEVHTRRVVGSFNKVEVLAGELS